MGEFNPSAGASWGRGATRIMMKALDDIDAECQKEMGRSPTRGELIAGFMDCLGGDQAEEPASGGFWPTMEPGEMGSIAHRIFGAEDD